MSHLAKMPFQRRMIRNYYGRHGSAGAACRSDGRRRVDDADRFADFRPTDAASPHHLTRSVAAPMPDYRFAGRANCDLPGQDRRHCAGPANCDRSDRDFRRCANHDCRADGDAYSYDSRSDHND